MIKKLKQVKALHGRNDIQLSSSRTNRNNSNTNSNTKRSELTSRNNRLEPLFSHPPNPYKKLKGNYEDIENRFEDVGRNGRPGLLNTHRPKKLA